MCEELEAVAYYYGMKPEEFYKCVPARFYRWLKAREKVEHTNYIQQNVRFGKLCAVFVNMFGKNTTKPSDFFDVDYKYKEKKQAASVEEIALRLTGYCARLGGTIET
jgi:hypothetical protein